ncbi:MAG: TPM domain-containing protein [Clostridia bacterium]|nr:TPM domain-containing protein [Clostridia bacterium]
MKKIALIFLLALSICAFSLNLVCAAGAPRLVDQADILTSSEESQLLSLLNEISERQQMDIVVVTVDSLGGKSPRAYADDYYDYNGYGADGILLLIAMDSRDYYISTTGYGIEAVTDEGLSYMEDRFVDDLSDGDYASAFTTYAELCDDFITQARSGDPYDRGNMPKSDFPWGQNLLISLAVGFVIAFIVTAIMRSKLKSVRPKSGASDYVRQGSFQLTRSNDLYLYRRVTRRAKPKDNGSGGSSTHSSSSGRSHGGGGGKF